jgi:hypothetical protein
MTRFRRSTGLSVNNQRECVTKCNRTIVVIVIVASTSTSTTTAFSLLVVAVGDGRPRRIACLVQEHACMVVDHTHSANVPDSEKATTTKHRLSARAETLLR